jgi:hypothetical protein
MGTITSTLTAESVGNQPSDIRNIIPSIGSVTTSFPSFTETIYYNSYTPPLTIEDRLSAIEKQLKSIEEKLDRILREVR